MKPAIVSLCAIAAACSGKAQPVAPDVPAPEVVFERARPGVPWPDAVPRCEIALDPQETGDELGLFRDPTLRDETARLHHQMYYGDALPGRIGELPAIGTSKAARFWLSAPLETDGWTELPRAATLLHRVDVVPGHVWLPAHALAWVQGTNGSKVVARAETPFARPAFVEAELDCQVFGSNQQAQPPLRSGIPVKLRAQPIEWFAAPGSQRILVVEPNSANPPEGPTILELARRDGFVRLFATYEAGARRGPRFPSAAFDGWVREGDVEPLGPDDGDRGFGHGTDLEDRCDQLETTRRTRVLQGTDEQVPENLRDAGAIESGTKIQVDELRRRGGLVPFHFYRHGLRASQGSFWIDEASVDWEAAGCIEDPVDP